ncbi:MAG: cobalamin biosynthesis protein CbiG [Chloroflexi bacterium]|nr:cobalamin biosynthesis protein CbiG [Chloroflexota bacterium]
MGTTTSAEYFRTRRECVDYLHNRLTELVKQRKRVLLGFDFAYGYPKGFADALGLSGPGEKWRKIWGLLANLIHDEDNNQNNRFEVAEMTNRRCTGGSEPGPFWGCPKRSASRLLPTTKPTFPFRCNNGVVLEDKRLCETRLRGTQPIWKLAYRGSVGSQTFMGIPRLYELRDAPHLAAHSRVWPFETGFTARLVPPKGPFILHAEIWPGIVNNELDRNIKPKDKAQVMAMANWAARLDARGSLGLLFDAPQRLSQDQLSQCREEGWILGCT